MTAEELLIDDLKRRFIRACFILARPDNDPNGITDEMLAERYHNDARFNRIVKELTYISKEMYEIGYKRGGDCVMEIVHDQARKITEKLQNERHNPNGSPSSQAKG